MLRQVLAVGVLVFASSVFAPASAESCSNLQAQAQGAIQSHNTERAKVLFRSMEDTGCDAAYREWLGRQIASDIYNIEIAKGKPNAQILKGALQFGRPWQLLATLGDLAAEAVPRNWSEAAEFYQEALNEIRDASHTPAPPPEDVIRGLVKKAEQAGLLAQDYVPARRSRDGSNGGIAARSVRGIDIVAVAMPVEFVFGLTEMTPKGLAAAEDMVLFLQNDRPMARRIRLLGHTDPRGSDAFNMDLSMRRAQALARFMRSKGLTAEIIAEGRGFREPYPYDQPTKYTQEERYQMDRRVELKRE